MSKPKPKTTDKIRTLEKHDDGSERVLRVMTNETENDLHVSVNVGRIAPIQEGSPIPPGADLIQADDDPDGDGWRGVKTVFKTNDGPAMTNSAAYLKGWDTIWGSKKSASQNLPN